MDVKSRQILVYRQSEKQQQQQKTTKNKQNESKQPKNQNKTKQNKSNKQTSKQTSKWSNKHVVLDLIRLTVDSTVNCLLLEQELPTNPEHLSSPSMFSGVRVARSSV